MGYGKGNDDYDFQPGWKEEIQDSALDATHKIKQAPQEKKSEVYVDSIHKMRDEIYQSADNDPKGNPFAAAWSNASVAVNNADTKVDEVISDLHLESTAKAIKDFNKSLKKIAAEIAKEAFWATEDDLGGVLLLMVIEGLSTKITEEMLEEGFQKSEKRGFFLPDKKLFDEKGNPIIMTESESFMEEIEVQTKDVFNDIKKRSGVDIKEDFDKAMKPIALQLQEQLRNPTRASQPDTSDISQVFRNVMAVDMAEKIGKRIEKGLKDAQYTKDINNLHIIKGVEIDTFEINKEDGELRATGKETVDIDVSKSEDIAKLVNSMMGRAGYHVGGESRSMEKDIRQERGDSEIESDKRKGNPEAYEHDKRKGDQDVELDTRRHSPQETIKLVRELFVEADMNEKDFAKLVGLDEKQKIDITGNDPVIVTEDSNGSIKSKQSIEEFTSSLPPENRDDLYDSVLEKLQKVRNSDVDSKNSLDDIPIGSLGANLKMPEKSEEHTKEHSENDKRVPNVVTVKTQRGR